MYLKLLLCFLMMIYVAMTTSIVQTYIALSVGDYRWWWRSYLVGFCGGVMICAFCICLSGEELSLGYVLWTLSMCSFVGMIAGTCSFAGSYFFVKRIYA